VDWHDTQALALALRSAVVARGPVVLAVCWVHLDAPSALPTVLDVIADERRPPRVFHIVGVESADPMRSGAEPERDMPGTWYRRVVLGFIVEASGARWLTDEEICAGVIAAIENDVVESVIGVARP
jgi:hypothetical protein